jgi:hypothetical protein
MAKNKGGGGSGKKPKHSNDANRSNAKGAKGGQRDAATVSAQDFLRPMLSVQARSDGHALLQVRRLNMYNTRAVRDKKGKILHEVRPG